MEGYFEDQPNTDRTMGVSHSNDIDFIGQSEQVQIFRLPPVEEEEAIFATDMRLGNIFASIRSDYGNYRPVDCSLGCRSDRPSWRRRPMVRGLVAGLHNTWRSRCSR